MFKFKHLGGKGFLIWAKRLQAANWALELIILSTAVSKVKNSPHMLNQNGRDFLHFLRKLFKQEQFHFSRTKCALWRWSCHVKKKNLQYAKWVFTVALVLSIFHEVPGSCDILGLSQSYSKICNSSDSVLMKYYNYIICFKKYHKSTTRSTK